MVVNTLMIGKIKSVRRVEMTKKVGDEWKNDYPMIEVTVESEIPDDNGESNFSMDKYPFEATEYPKYKALEHKIVAVPYVLKIEKSGQKWDIDSNTPIFELKDSFMNLIKVDKTIKA